MGELSSSTIQAIVPAARLLVVDDDVSRTETLARGLRLQGFDVETAASGADALERLATGGVFDLAIVDLMMRGLNGIDFARAVQRAHPRTRVVLTSAYHVSERQLARCDCGVVGFVPKPYVLDELATFLRSKLPEGATSPSSPAPPSARTRYAARPT